MSWRPQALEHAKQEAPRESCGLLVIVKGKEVYYPCRNDSLLTEQFILNAGDYARAEDMGEILAVVHSHPAMPAVPSEADLIGCEQSGLTWHIVNPNNEEWCEFSPSGYKAPLVGRQWVWAVTDCWALVRDWYAEHGVILRDWQRPSTPSDFDASPMFADCWQRTGFRELEPDEELKYGDGLLMAIGGDQLNHIAVYVGDGLVLHHLRPRLSSIDMYGGWLQKSTGLRMRHYAYASLSAVK